jgi:hypothetical protein
MQRLSLFMESSFGVVEIEEGEVKDSQMCPDG